MSQSEHHAESKPSGPARKPYASPTLTEYGSVAKLTLSGGVSMTETGVPNMRP